MNGYKLLIARLKKRTILIIASFVLQSILGLFLGHHYDMGIFFVSGYEVSNWVAPYGIFPARSIFNNQAFFEELPGIGYPPPWGLFLGLMYFLIFEPTGNIFVYNLSIKLPSILSNITLAFIIERIAIQEGMKKEKSDKIFYFLLFNPFMIYISAIWGQFDSLVIMTSILAIIFLFNGKVKTSSVIMAFSASLKIIPLILLPALLLFIKRNYDLRRTLEFISTFSILFLSFVYSPFIIFNWDLRIILNDLDFHFIRAGCFTLFNILDLMYNTEILPHNMQFFGYLWILGLTLGYYELRKTRLRSRLDLFRWALSLIFILMLTRTWVSEQNIALLIPLSVLYSIRNIRDWIMVDLLWILAFIFTFFNTSPFQMFFLISPKPLKFIEALDQVYRIPRLFLKFITVIPWQIIGWLYVMQTFNKNIRKRTFALQWRN